MVTVSRDCTQFIRGLFEIPRNFMVFNSENWLIGIK